jgi:hypothetical protein
VKFRIDIVIGNAYDARTLVTGNAFRQKHSQSFVGVSGYGLESQSEFWGGRENYR